jgi:hypothetical protein
MEHLLKINEMEENRYIPLDKVVELLKVSINSIYLMTDRGQLRLHKFNGMNYYSTFELKDMVKRIQNKVGYYTKFLTEKVV